MSKTDPMWVFENYGAAAELIDELEAELEAARKQEPVAIANKGDCAFWVRWTEAGKPLRGPGIKLYALPPLAGQVSVPDGYEAGLIAAQKIADRIAGNSKDFCRDTRKGAGIVSAELRALLATPSMEVKHDA